MTNLTDKQCDFLIKEYHTIGLRKAFEILSIPKSTLSTKIKELGLKFNNTWSKENIEFLKNFYPEYGGRFISDELNISFQKVRHKAIELKIKRNRINKPKSRICNNCKITKLISDFPISKKCLYGIRNMCRSCDNKSMAKKRKENPNYRLRIYLRNRIREMVKSKKSASTKILTGCSYGFLKAYLESKFQSGMNWENHGLYGWHIDHIKPCASFNLSNPDEQRACSHYTNLQPLWATTKIAREHGDFKSIGNIEKGNKIYVHSNT